LAGVCADFVAVLSLQPQPHPAIDAAVGGEPAKAAIPALTALASGICRVRVL
jgi:hypothetical protein